jgi:cell division protein FtsQ
LTADELVAAAGIAQGTPMMRVDLRAATARIADLPQVASVDVRRQWPRTILVEVTQRDAVAVRKAADGWELLDANGSAFAIAPSKPKDLPVVAAAPEPATETAMLQALAGMTPEIRAQVAEVAAVSPTAIRLTLRKGQAVVNWGSAEDAAFKSQVLAVLLGTKAGWYDVSNPQTPTTADAPPQPATPSAAPSDPAATAQPTASPVAPSPTVTASPEAAVSPLGVVTD